LFVLLSFFLWPLCCLFFFWIHWYDTPSGVITITIQEWNNNWFELYSVYNSLFRFFIKILEDALFAFDLIQHNITQSLVFCVMFCRSLFVLLSFFLWPLCCLFFFDLRIRITPFGIFKLFLLNYDYDIVLNKIESKQSIFQYFYSMSSSLFTLYIHRVTLVTNSVINLEWGKDWLWLIQTEYISSYLLNKWLSSLLVFSCVMPLNL
jgi:hypothetical protein